MHEIPIAARAIVNAYQCQLNQEEKEICAQVVCLATGHETEETNEELDNLLATIAEDATLREKLSWSFFTLCCVFGKTDIARKLVEFGFNPNANIADVRLPIEQAVDYSNFDMMETLIVGGASLSCFENRHVSSARAACILESLGVNIAYSENDLIAYAAQAMRTDDERCIKWLINKKICDIADKECAVKVLELIVKHNAPECMKRFIESGMAFEKANIDACIKTAFNKRMMSICKILLELGADVDSFNKDELKKLLTIAEPIGLAAKRLTAAIVEHELKDT